MVLEKYYDTEKVKKNLCRFIIESFFFILLMIIVAALFIAGIVLIILAIFGSSGGGGSNCGNCNGCGNCNCRDCDCFRGCNGPARYIEKSIPRYRLVPNVPSALQVIWI